MVENTKSTILEVQGSFGLTYMVGIIPLNLRSQEMDKGVPHMRAHASAAGRDGLGPGVAWCGEARRGRHASGRGVNLSVAYLFVSCMRDLCPSAARLLACRMRPFSFSFPLREVKQRRTPGTWYTRTEPFQSHSPATSENISIS